MKLFKTPDLTGWSYQATVEEDVSHVLVKDPEGQYWYAEKNKPVRYEIKQRNAGLYYSMIKLWPIDSITEAGIEKGAKKVILKCKRIYDTIQRKNAVRAESHTKEF